MLWIRTQDRNRLVSISDIVGVEYNQFYRRYDVYYSQGDYNSLGSPRTITLGSYTEESSALKVLNYIQSRLHTNDTIVMPKDVDPTKGCKDCECSFIDDKGFCKCMLIQHYVDYNPENGWCVDFKEREESNNG